MIKAIFRSPVTTAVLFIVAAALLLGGTVGAVRAAPNFQSWFYTAEVKLVKIHTVLTEYDMDKSGANKEDTTTYVRRTGDDAIVQNMVAEGGDTELKLGKRYDEHLAVRNDGDIDEYVRVTVKKYWVLTDDKGNPLKDANGDVIKNVDLDPSLIKIEFAEGEGWKKDAKSSTKDDGKTPVEQTVLYWDKELAPGESTGFFVKAVTIDSSVANRVQGGALAYKNVQFRIEARVDAVQTHNPDEAMRSAWGQTKDDV